jgi:ornithine cyclodeaminase/alanine dehydrogenase-like protein (mu-crystallin family)
VQQRRPASRLDRHRTMLFVDTDEAPTKSGDLLVPMQNGVFSANEARGTLKDLAAVMLVSESRDG